MTLTASLSPFDTSGPLRALAAELDPSADRLALGRDRYRDLGDWLRAHAGRTAQRDIEIYPQGSFNLGTTNQNPFTGEFDIDLVLRAAYTKSEISQCELNAIVNGWLGDYVSDRRREGHPLAPTELRRGMRAGTLVYDDGFHMDALPVVPAAPGELAASAGDPSWLTDKQLVRWQATNPRGFATWFAGLTDIERKVLAKRADVQVDPLPDDAPRTTLQMAIKILKRHRDHHFGDDLDKHAPPSALLSALAAKAYGRQWPGGGDLSAVLVGIVTDMPQHLEHRSGQLWVPNPTCDEENYADRYAGDLGKERALQDWLSTVACDLDALGQSAGLHIVSKSIDQAFGDGLGSRVAMRIGQDAARARTERRIGSASTGLLTTVTSRPHRPHTNFGRWPS